MRRSYRVVTQEAKKNGDLCADMQLAWLNGTTYRVVYIYNIAVQLFSLFCSLAASLSHSETIIILYVTG